MQKRFLYLYNSQKNLCIHILLSEVFVLRRKSIFYRKVWYIKRRNLHTINLFVRLLIAMSVIMLSFFIVGSTLAPALEEESERCVKARMEAVIEETVQEILSDSSIYNNIFIISYDYDSNYNSDDKEVGLYTMELERLAADVADRLSARLREQESIIVGAPLGNITGMGLMYGHGPVIKAHVLASGKAEVSCTCDSSKNKDTNAVNLVNMRIRAVISYHSLFINGSTEIVSSIPIIKKSFTD